MTSAIPIKQSINFRLLTKVFYLLGGNYMNWQFHCTCRNTSDMYQSCYKRFAGMQCIRVTSLKNVTLQTRRDDNDFNFTDRNGLVIINSFAYVFVHVTFKKNMYKNI